MPPPPFKTHCSCVSEFTGDDVPLHKRCGDSTCDIIILRGPCFELFDTDASASTATHSELLRCSSHKPFLL